MLGQGQHAAQNILGGIKKVTDLSVIPASACRLPLRGDEVRSRSPGLWTAWSRSPPSNPVN